MGNSASSGPGHHDDDPFDGADTLGYRVLGVQPNSPASRAGLVSFLDFLVGADNRMLLGSGEGLDDGQEYDDIDLPAILKEHIGKEMEFLVFNIKSQEARLVKLTPQDDWGGAGLLGVTIRLDNYAGADERLIRVLAVETRSPAAVAGLVPEKDFLLGTTHATLDSADALAHLLEINMDQVAEFYVYNSDSDLVRTVVLMPTLSWGGQGLLGAEVGTGYLHRLPSAVCSTDGASVERKVRYVEQSSARPDSQAPGAVYEKVAANHSDTKTTAKASVLEYEPQLEMEVGEEESSHDGKSESLSVNGAVSGSTPVATAAASAPNGAIRAEDVFARPPSQVDGPSLNPLPPPPKMQYNTPPSLKAQR